MPGLLAFHAHPDDESLAMGGTLASYTAAGEQVVVVTATRGEVGEVHNYDNPEEVAARLGEVRSEEMAVAMRALGVAHHHFLGYRDSGMIGTEDNAHENSFWQADFMEATGRLVHLIRKYRPEVVTAYDPYGGYGHPDHIQVHRVGTAAFFGAADVGRFPVEDGEEPWAASKLYWATFPRSAVVKMRSRAIATGVMTEEEARGEPDAGWLDDDITLWMPIRDQAEAKQAAVLAHHSQIPADSWFRTLRGSELDGFLSRESFVKVFSRVDTPVDEADLFAGLR
jgi:N-acetyl-1-D-myo-inositol-2-amino-2-deoxy-alpha-D-glucopyranoside deacetylase